MKDKDPAASDKPDYLTGYMMVKDILPELSKRINLGAHKYEPDDWKGRDPKYFWQKHHRHMKDATGDWNSMDEDGLPHLTAMWFHITALVWKRQFENTMQELSDEGQTTWGDPLANIQHTDETQEPTEAPEILCFDEWRKQRGFKWYKNEHFDTGFWGRGLMAMPDEMLRKVHLEYVAERRNASDRPEAH